MSGRLYLAAVACALATQFAGCSSSGSGGALGDSGADSTGGVGVVTGGAPSAGGVSVDTGGVSVDTGGAGVATGGVTGTGGDEGSSGGTPSSGGAAASGGGSASGGDASSGGEKASSGGAPGAALTVYIAGDSTVSTYTLPPGAEKPQAGWGQLLHEFFDSRVTVRNEAIGGRTARRFVLEGRLDELLGTLARGDYLLVQFGTNESNKTATYTIDGVSYPYYAAASSDFKTYLQPFIDGAKGKGAVPILVTPPPRNSAYCGGPRSLAEYGQAMLEVGQAQGLFVLDLGKAAHAYLSAICPKPANGAAENFFKVNADGTIDGTHFQLEGARALARFVAEAVDESPANLRQYRLR